LEACLSDALTIGCALRRSAQQYPNRTAYIFRDERLTFRAYNRLVNKCAHVLEWLGLTKGDHFVVLGRNSLNYLALYHASAKMGTVFGPLNWRLAPQELSFIVDDGDNKVLFVEAEMQELASKFLDGLPSVRVVVFGGEAILEGATSLDTLLETAQDCEPCVDINGSDDALILYTSGTTGLPKGAVLTHANIMWDATACITYIPPRQDDLFLLSMPMSHVSGLHIQPTSFLIRGLPTVGMPQWEAEEACRLIERHRITLACILVAPLLQLLALESKKKYDLTSLRRVMTAAARYASDLPIRVMSELGAEQVFFTYGLTEAAPMVTLTEFTSHMLAKPNTLGSPVWYNDVRIADDSDVSLPIGEVGEILVRGPNVFKGYYKRPEANAAALKNGWLHTGDLGYLDEDNCLFFVDRKKDMIKSGGENVYSIEVEQALQKAASEIEEVAVVGVPDDKWGEAVIAFVVLKADANLTGEELIQRVRPYLGGFKVPKRVICLTELPKNISGKVLKRKLREDFANA